MMEHAHSFSVESAINKVSKLTFLLQQQRDVPLWAITNEHLIYAIAVGENVYRGPRQNILYFIIKLAYKIKISDLVILACGLFVILTIWFGAKKQKNIKVTKINRIFACCGCLSDKKIYSDYLTRAKDEPLKINWITKEGLSALELPTLYRLVFQLMKQSIGHTKKLENSIQDISAHVLDFLTTGAVNIGDYIFYREYWEQAIKVGATELSILVPSVQAFAAVDVGLRTIFLQHGLLVRGILMPQFTRIEALTLEEVSYFRKILPKASVYKCSGQVQGNPLPKKDVILCLSVNLVTKMLGEYIEIWHEVNHWAKMVGLSVVIRPTPNVKTQEIEYLKKQFPEAVFDDLNDTMESSLEKWQPKFVIAWRSTGLVTALEHGYLPIMLHSNESCLYIWNLIYPMKERFLFWNKDADKIADALQSTSKYNEIITQLNPSRTTEMIKHSESNVAI